MGSTGSAHPEQPTPSATRATVAALLGVLLAGALGACTQPSSSSGTAERSAAPSGSPGSPGSPGSSGSPGPTTAASTAPAGGGDTADEPPTRPSGLGRTVTGQKRFARYVVRAWGYALAHNTAGPLRSLSPKSQPCQGCAKLARELRSRDRQGWHVAFPGAEVRGLRVRGGSGSSTAPTTVVARVRIPESTAYNDDGSYRSTSPGHPRARFAVTMRFARHHFRLVSFRVSG